MSLQGVTVNGCADARCYSEWLCPCKVLQRVAVFMQHVTESAYSHVHNATLYTSVQECACLTFTSKQNVYMCMSLLRLKCVCAYAANMPYTDTSFRNHRLQLHHPVPDHHQPPTHHLTHAVHYSETSIPDTSGTHLRVLNAGVILQVEHV